MFSVPKRARHVRREKRELGRDRAPSRSCFMTNLSSDLKRRVIWRDDIAMIVDLVGLPGLGGML